MEGRGREQNYRPAGQLIMTLTVDKPSNITMKTALKEKGEIVFTNRAKYGVTKTKNNIY